MEAERQKQLVKKQFGRSSSEYATSDVHAQGESLGVLKNEVCCQPDWRVLDVATGAGHTAHLFAAEVLEVVATDITEAMLDKTGELSRQLGLDNVQVQLADAESLPFENGSFDLVTCRLASHHFPQPARAASEMFRVLKPNGWLGFTDNFTVDAAESIEAYNQFERLRDPSHVDVPSYEKLKAQLTGAGFSIQSEFQLQKEFEFHQWADRQQVSQKDKQRLIELMKHIPNDLQGFFCPRWEEHTFYFLLHEAVFIGRKSTD